MKTRVYTDNDWPDVVVVIYENGSGRIGKRVYHDDGELRTDNYIPPEYALTRFYTLIHESS